MRPPWFFIVGVTCAFAVGPSPFARAADPPPADRVDDLKRAGDELLVDGHPIDALKYYDQALALRRDPAILYNRGRAYNALARYPQALADFEAFERSAPPALLERVPALKDFLANVRGRVATLNIDCDVPGAAVRVGADEVGVTPLEKPIVLNAGTLVVAVEKPGYFPFKRTVEVAGGGTSFVGVRLALRATTGILTVTSTTTGAEVRVDGARVGTVPAELSVTPGQHRVDVAHPGYESGSRFVLVQAGESKDVAMPLDAERSIVTRWWFWTAIGVVALGGTATVYALTKERPLGQGDIEPGNLRAGIRF